MRTTLDLDEEMLRRARKRAGELRTTLSAVAEGALEREVADGSATGEGPRPPFPTWDGGGFPEGVDWTSNREIADFLEGTERQATTHR